MTLWYASHELLLTAAGTIAATLAESLRLAIESGLDMSG